MHFSPLNAIKEPLKLSFVPNEENVEMAVAQVGSPLRLIDD